MTKQFIIKPEVLDKTIGITGASGYLGRNLIPMFLSSGIKVVAFSRNNLKFQFSSPNLKYFSQNFVKISVPSKPNKKLYNSRLEISIFKFNIKVYFFPTLMNPL